VTEADQQHMLQHIITHTQHPKTQQTAPSMNETGGGGGGGAGPPPPPPPPHSRGCDGECVLLFCAFCWSRRLFVVCNACAACCFRGHAMQPPLLSPWVRAAAADGACHAGVQRGLLAALA
jgi:hypothetical protein